MKNLTLIISIILTSLFSMSDNVNAQNDYPSFWTNSGGCCFTSACVDGYAFYEEQCTSYAAWRMNRDHDNSPTIDPDIFYNNMTGSGGSTNCTYNTGRLSNACRWAMRLQAQGYYVSPYPVVGSIAQWNASEAGNSEGHVAYVESVNTDGTVNVSEYNWNYTCDYGTRNNITAPRYIRFNRLKLTSSVNISPNPIIQNSPVTITASLNNNSGYSYTTNVRAALYSSSNQFLSTIQQLSNVSFSPNQTKNLNFYKSSIINSPGNYKIWIETKTGSGPWVLVHKQNISSTQTVSISSSTTNPIAEIKNESVNHYWKTVNYSYKTDPVVLASANTTNGTDFFVTEIKDVTNTSCKVRIREADCLNYLHVNEDVTMTIWNQPGVYNVGGAQVIVGKTTANNTFSQVNFSSSFSVPPVIIATPTQPTSSNMGVVRACCLGTSKVKFRMQNPSGGTFNGNSTVHYMAVNNNYTANAGPSSNPTSVYFKSKIQGNVSHVTDPLAITNNFGSSTNVLSFCQSNSGTDPVVAKIKNLSSNGGNVQVQETTCGGYNGLHNNEYVGLVRLTDGPYMYGTLISTSPKQSLYDDELIEYKEISVFPNPAKDRFTVSYLSEEDSSVEVLIYDLQGKLMQEEQINMSAGQKDIDIALPSLNNGMYLLLLNNGEKQFTTKFMIQE